MMALLRQRRRFGLWRMNPETKDRARSFWQKVVCKVAGCRWGSWIPTSMSHSLSGQSVQSALRQCLRCRTMQHGPVAIPHEHRTLP